MLLPRCCRPLTTATAPNPADFPQQKKLAQNVYVWSDVHPSGLYTTNNLIVITTDGVLVADGQRDAETTKKMIDGIAALTRQPIKVVVIGSEHGDHTGGNASFPSTVTFIKSPLPKGKQTTLKMGGTEIQVLDRGRAHTGTDLEVYLPKEKILFASEAYSNHIFPNMRAAVPAEWIQTVKNIRQIDANTIIPGHGVHRGRAGDEGVACGVRKGASNTSSRKRRASTKPAPRLRPRPSKPTGVRMRRGPQAIGTRRLPSSASTTRSTEN